MALVGDIGAGKTTFVQGLAESLGILRVVSPTFIIMRKYNLRERNFYHLDLYRLEGNIEEELKNIGFLEILDEKDAITVVEWAERARGIFPPETVCVNFKETGEARTITLPNTLGV